MVAVLAIGSILCASCSGSVNGSACAEDPVLFPTLSPTLELVDVGDVATTTDSVDSSIRVGLPANGWINLSVVHDDHTQLHGGGEGLSTLAMTRLGQEISVLVDETVMPDGRIVVYTWIEHEHRFTLAARNVASPAATLVRAVEVTEDQTGWDSAASLTDLHGLPTCVIRTG